MVGSPTLEVSSLKVESGRGKAEYDVRENGPRKVILKVRRISEALRENLELNLWGTDIRRPQESDLEGHAKLCSGSCTLSESKWRSFSEGSACQMGQDITT